MEALCGEAADPWRFSRGAGDAEWADRHVGASIGAEFIATLDNVGSGYWRD
jgi:hypothetical protein